MPLVLSQSHSATQKRIQRLEGMNDFALADSLKNIADLTADQIHSLLRGKTAAEVKMACEYLIHSRIWTLPHLFEFAKQVNSRTVQNYAIKLFELNKDEYSHWKDVVQGMMQ